LGLTLFTNSDTPHEHNFRISYESVPQGITLRLIRETVYSATLDDRLFFLEEALKNKVLMIDGKLKKSPRV
jgi:hypothetical protein